MTVREPPKIAVWLLRRWSSAYQREALLGDINEMYCTGRSRAWYWRQVLAALYIGRAKALRLVIGPNVGTTLLRLLNALLLAGVIALGLGSLTQADTARLDGNGAHAR